MACNNKILDLLLMDIGTEILIDKYFSYFHFESLIHPWISGASAH